MGQLPGPSYPFGWPDRPPSPDEEPPGRPEWWRWFVCACAALLLLVLGGLVIAACGDASLRP